MTYSAANWPSGTTKLMECDSNDALCMEKYRINAAMIQVFYEELNYQTLAESPAYSVSEGGRGEGKSQNEHHKARTHDPYAFCLSR